MDTTTDREETEKIIGDWTKRAHWEKETMGRKIEHIAIFLASRPKERRRLSALGALRLNREEARSIIRKKTTAFTFFATVSTTISMVPENTEVISLSIQMINQVEERRPTTF